MNCKTFLLVASLAGGQCLADPVWHCSRLSGASKEEVIAKAEQFSIASVGNSDEVIGISIRDLMDVYSGVPVKVGSQTLSACFISGNDAVTAPALKSLALQASAIQALTRKSTLVQSHVYMVADETGMQVCIGKHFPAVGYLSQPTETTHLLPCF